MPVSTRTENQRRGWWSQAGSNRRPPHCERGALPAELWPLKDTQKREKYAVARRSSVGVIYGRGIGVSRSANDGLFLLRVKRHDRAGVQFRAPARGQQPV